MFTIQHLTQISGAGRGKAVTVPTINFAVPAELAGIPFGVYAGKIVVNGKSHASAIHYGPIPTFADDEPRFEVNLIDEFGITFPPETLFDVTLVEKIRDIQKFENPESLKKQIFADIEQIREILAKI